MFSWEWESFNSFLNSNYFSVEHSGPLHAPIRNFSLYRNDKLDLVLETLAQYDARATRNDQPAAAVHINTDKVEFLHVSGIKAVARGVQPLKYTRHSDFKLGTEELREESSLDSIESIIDTINSPKYIVDWLQNVDKRYLWPDFIEDESQIVRSRALNSDQSSLTWQSISKSSDKRRGCVKITVDGFDVYLGTASSEKTDEHLKRGFILYLGNPPEEIRDKIRVCLSFSLGMFLVHLGNSAFNEDWSLNSFKARSAYSLHGRVFDLPVMPPAPLDNKRLNVINRETLSKMVNALYTHYDALNLTQLSWSFWHAICAPVHAAPVHFGAAIEALQSSYLNYQKKINTKLLDANNWNNVKEQLEKVVSNIPIEENIKNILFKKIGAFNQVPQNILTEWIFEDLMLKLGEPEKRAWKQRNDAGHGNQIKSEDFITYIRNTKLLRIRFVRMLLRITGASEFYNDYYSIGHPIRRIEDAILE